MHPVVVDEKNTHKDIYNRFEKVAAAFYLITNHLSDSDPLKISIRQKTISLLELVSDLNTDNFMNSLFKKDNINDVCEQIISLLKMAVQAGLVRRLNVEIIISENEKTRAALDKLTEDLVYNSENNKGLFRYTEGAPVGVGGTETGTAITDKKGIKDGMTTHKRGYTQENQTPKKDIISGVNGYAEQVKPRKKNRREFILGVIGQKGEVTIKDISSVFKGCSEKTIQRELISLVEEGVVSKEGERRWSKYKLAHALN